MNAAARKKDSDGRPRFDVARTRGGDGGGSPPEARGGILQQQLESGDRDVDNVLEKDVGDGENWRGQRSSAGADESEYAHGGLRDRAVSTIDNTATALRDSDVGSQDIGDQRPRVMADKEAVRSQTKNRHGRSGETCARSSSIEQSASVVVEQLGHTDDDLSGDARVSTTETEISAMPTSERRHPSTYSGADARKHADVAFRGSQKEKQTEQKSQAGLLDDEIAVSAGDTGVAEQDSDEMLWTQTDSARGGGGGGDDSAGQADRAEPQGDVSSGNSSRVVDTAARNGDPAHVSTTNGNGDADGQANTGDDGGRQDILEWRPRKGDLVEVERRMAPGVNKLGGTGRVVKVNSETGAVDVRYVVERGWERGIDLVYVRPAVLNLSEVKRPTLGRCQHCGSLRVDCRQGCEYYTAPPSQRSLPYMPSPHQLSPAARPDGGSSRNTGPIGEASLGGLEENQRKGRGRHDRHRLPAMDDGVAIERDGRQRRRLREDWDEEGVPMPGSEEEEEANDGNRRGSVDDDGERSDSESLGSSGGDGSSHGTKSDDGRRWRNRRRRKIYDESDSEHSDSDVEFLAVRNASRRDHHSWGDNNLYSSGDQSNGDEADPGQGGSSRFAPHGRRRGGRSEAEDTRAEHGAARFLMPEGEEASRALPSDIVDPTRGVRDPVLLRRELTSLLKQLEECVVKLERDVPSVCR